jgi:hypothetical protein
MRRSRISEIGNIDYDIPLESKKTDDTIESRSAGMTATHKDLLNTIKTAIDQLSNDQSVPRKQTMRELVDIREYLQSALEIIRDETNGGIR